MNISILSDVCGQWWLHFLLIIQSKYFTDISVLKKCCWQVSKDYYLDCEVFYKGFPRPFKIASDLELEIRKLKVNIFSGQLPTVISLMIRIYCKAHDCQLPPGLQRPLSECSCHATLVSQCAVYRQLTLRSHGALYSSNRTPTQPHATLQLGRENSCSQLGLQANT